MKNYFSQKFRLILTAVTGLAVLSLLIGACSNNETTETETIIPSQPTMAMNATPINTVVDANTRFSFKLFNQIYQQQENQNIVISPASISAALSMTYNGAKGETQEAIANTLELSGISLEDINQGNLELKQSLETTDEKITLNIANSLWLDQSTSFLPDFIQRVAESYKAELTQLDFSDPNSAAEVNNWVTDKTNNKIDKIVDRIEPNQILFLINAVYFKAPWRTPFSEAATEAAPFTLLDGSTKQHPLMNHSGDYGYFETNTLQAIHLPYGEGRWGFYVFLPKTGMTLASFYETLTAENWEEWMKELRYNYVPGSITLPRFTLEYDIALNDTLKALGMEMAFDPQQSDFSGMTETPATISQVKHKTFIEVNEEGTEAAAVTSVGIVATSVPPPPFSMVVDRPFFCAIRDNETGTILFMGSIVDP
jgi:serine protease inhibitor